MSGMTPGKLRTAQNRSAGTLQISPAALRKPFSTCLPTEALRAGGSCKIAGGDFDVTRLKRRYVSWLDAYA